MISGHLGHVLEQRHEGDAAGVVGEHGHRQLHAEQPGHLCGRVPCEELTAGIRPSGGGAAGDVGKSRVSFSVVLSGRVSSCQPRPAVSNLVQSRLVPASPVRRNVGLDQRDRVEGGGEGGDRKLAHDMRVKDVVGRAEQERACNALAN